mgnify:CR=1 FL=1
MKKYMIIASILVIGWFVFDQLYFYTGDLYLPNTGEISFFTKAEDDLLYLDTGDGFDVYDLKGVNMGLGKPGYYATEKAITRDEYLRWFRQIKELGANTIRVYTLGNEAFYDAFYEYNLGNDDPLYLIHGVWVDDYLINSSYSALDKEFYEPFIESCYDIVDAIHGRLKIPTDTQILPYSYLKDISPWVVGYILGVEWESTLVSYTDDCFEQLEQFNGTYFYTENASNFEIFLAGIGNAVAEYETNKYGSQRLIAFSNWATTDPFEYPSAISQYFEKCGTIDTEHIKCTDKFSPGQFASYHVYPYYPDYYSYTSDHEENTYLQYLTILNEHHSMPVVISEFGVSSGRGMASYDSFGRNQGGISETQQGIALVSLYRDIIKAGSCGAIAFTWQDEWFKRTWNTMAGTDLLATPYWSDYQTNEQYFGLLSFDPGAEESICYVDTDCSDWSEDDVISDDGTTRLSVKYDEKFIYFLIEQIGFSLQDTVLYIPIDTTPKSGSIRAEDPEIEMSAPADFIIVINGEDKSRVLVHERYDIIDALFYNAVTSHTIFSKQFPASDSPNFVPIRMLLQRHTFYRKESINSDPADDTPVPFHEFDFHDRLHYEIEETYETGKLTYGNANPNSEGFNSLADFCAGNGFVEIKIPWGLLNFSDPSQMNIHDDYYEHYGVEYLRIRSMGVGVGDGNSIIQMTPVALQPLGKKPSYHERLKESYYILQSEWRKNSEEDVNE